MLNRIIQNKEDVKFILVKDDFNTHGIPVVSALVNEFQKRYNKIFLLQYDYPKQDSIYKRLKDVVMSPNCTVTCFDGFTDPLNWDNHNYQDDIIGYDLENTLCKIDGNLIIINSLTPLIINISANELYRQIHKWRVKFSACKVIALLHTDVHDSLEIKIIEKLADAILNISRAVDKPNLTSCCTLLKKSNGKVLTKTELFKINSNFEVSIEDSSDKSSEEIPKAIDPASNLTFNLTLKDDEKKARRELILPYTQASNAESGGGKIIYNLDSVDDFDEDDPDDDLDI